MCWRMERNSSVSEKEYLSRFALAVRWRLGAQEAAEAIEDYRELLACEQDAAQTPVQRFGTPVQAARLLVNWKAYLQWLAAFAVMSISVLWMAAGVWSDRGVYAWFPMWMMDGIVRAAVLMGTGTLAALWGFRRRERVGVPVRRVLWALAAIAAVGAAAAACIAYFCVELLPRTEELTPQEIDSAVCTLHAVMYCAGAVLAAAALAALIAARFEGRRWRAAYVLALCLLAALTVVAVIFRHLSDPDAFPIALWRNIAPFGLAGLVLTGVSLC